MSGIDMLVKNIMQAAGVDPEKVKLEIQQYGKQLAEKIESMDRSMRELKEQQALMYDLLLGLALKDRKQGEIAAALDGAYAEGRRSAPGAKGAIAIGKGGGVNHA